VKAWLLTIETMADFAQRACSTVRKPDFLRYNEFPLTGWSSGTLDELQFTIAVPGAETERFGAVARACDTYLIFGSYVRDDTWAGHILSIRFCARSTETSR